MTMMMVVIELRPKKIVLVHELVMCFPGNITRSGKMR